MRVLLATLLLLATGTGQAASIQLLNQAGHTGVPAPYPSGFNNPHGLVISPDGNRLYVADTGNGVVQVRNAHSLRPMGVIGQSVLKRPVDLALDSTGRLYVTDEGSNRIVVFDVSQPMARLVSSLDRGFAGPDGIAFDAYQRMYVSNSRSHILMMLSHDKPVVLKRTGGQGQDAGMFVGPGHIGFAPNGMVVIADTGNNRLQLLTPNLDPVSVIPGGEDYQFSRPEGFCINPEGIVFVSDTGHQRVLVLNSQFQRLATLGHAGNGRYGLHDPSGLACRGRQLWVADRLNHRVLHYRLY